MTTLFRCPRCGSVTDMAPQLGDEVIAVYHLCGNPDEPRGVRVPVRMERVVDSDLIAKTSGREAEPALAR